MTTKTTQEMVGPTTLAECAAVDELCLSRVREDAKRCWATIPGAAPGSLFACKLPDGHPGYCWAGRDVYFVKGSKRRATEAR